MILQRITAQQLKVGQRIKFKNNNTWWTVTGHDNNGYTIVSKGQQTKRLSKDYELLQEPFDNLNTKL